MKRFSFVFAVILILTLCTLRSAPCATVNFTASWTAPTTNADGTPLTDLAGYNLYRTDGARTKLNSSLITTTSFPFSLNLLASGTLTFVCTAVDTSNNESVDSNVATYVYTLPDTMPPAAPKNLLIQKQ